MEGRTKSDSDGNSLTMVLGALENENRKYSGSRIRRFAQALLQGCSFNTTGRGNYLNLPQRILPGYSFFSRTKVK
jgi:hypothetical protein